MSATNARTTPFRRLATAAVAVLAALGMAACSGGAGSSASSGTQVGDRSPEQIKEAGEIVIGIFSDKAPFGYIDANGKPAGYDVVYGDRIAVGCDALNGEVKTAGWVEGSGLDYVDFAKQMESIGVKTLIFTDIATDGMLSGPSFAALERLQKAVSCQIVASGGVSNNEDIRKLKEMGLYGAIIGKAYYAGTIDLAQAVADGGSQDNP